MGSWAARACCTSRCLVLAWPALGTCSTGRGGLRIGMLEYMLCTLVSGCGMLCITLCLAEMTSALPFGGGLYGFARVTMGPYIGFLVGCCELLQSIAYTSTPLLPAGRYLTGLFDLPKVFDVVFWALLAALALAINLLGVRAFWTSNAILVSVLIVLMLIYYAVAIPCMDCHEYGSVGFEEVGTSRARDWFKTLPYSFGLFVGLELLPLACSDAIKPTFTVPRAQIISFAVLAVNAFLLIAVASCNTPGPVAISGSADSVLYYAYHSRMHMTTQVAKALSIPALFASSCAFMYVYGKQLRSMAESGLFPTVLKHSFGEHKVPHVALTMIVVVCFIIFLSTEYIDDRAEQLFIALGYFANMLIDACLLVGFLQFRFKYSSLPRHFTSPLGLFGAVLGILIFTLGFFSFAGLYYKTYPVILMLMIFFGVCSVHYHYHVKPFQHFSVEEQKVMFTAYVINGNRRFKLKVQRRVSSTNSSARTARTTPRASRNSALRSSRTWASGAQVFPTFDVDDNKEMAELALPPIESVVESPEDNQLCALNEIEQLEAKDCDGNAAGPLSVIDYDEGKE